MIQLGGLWVTQTGQTVEFPDSTAAMLGWTRAPSITSTPFADANAGNTLGKRGDAGPGGPLAPDAACTGLQYRVDQYGPLDPQPAIRAALITKCEAYRRANPPTTRALNPDEQGGGIDTKTKVAIGAVALLAIVVVAKKMKKKR